MMTRPASSDEFDRQDEPGRYEPTSIHPEQVSHEDVPDETEEPEPQPEGPDRGARDKIARDLVISDVQVRPVSNNEKLRAWVTITFNDAFVVKGIRIIKGHSRLFVAMPSKQQKDGTFQDIAHPIDSDFRNYLEDRIIDVYVRLTATAGERRPGE